MTPLCSYSRAVGLGLVILAALTVEARADIAPPGGKFISHMVRFESLDQYPDQAFFVGWYVSFNNPAGEWKVRRLGPTGEISMQPPETPPYDPKVALAAVPKAMADAAESAHGNPEWFVEGMTPGVKIANLDVGLIRTAPVTDLRDTLWTVYRVKLGDELTLERIRHDTPGAGPAAFGVLIAVVLLAGAALVAVVLLIKRFLRGSVPAKDAA